MLLRACTRQLVHLRRWCYAWAVNIGAVALCEFCVGGSTAPVSVVAACRVSSVRVRPVHLKPRSWCPSPDPTHAWAAFNAKERAWESPGGRVRNFRTGFLIVERGAGRETAHTT